LLSANSEGIEQIQNGLVEIEELVEAMRENLPSEREWDDDFEGDNLAVVERSIFDDVDE
jgi:hypothetical protein